MLQSLLHQCTKKWHSGTFDIVYVKYIVSGCQGLWRFKCSANGFPGTAAGGWCMSPSCNLYPSLQFTLAIYTLPASRQCCGKEGSICRPLAFCLNSSWLCFSAWYRMEGRGWGQGGESGDDCRQIERWWTAEWSKRQWHKDRLFIFMTATPQRESEGIGRGELKDAKGELQRCGILLEGERERERCKGGWWGGGGVGTRQPVTEPEICEALGSTVHTFDKTDGTEL